MIQQSKQINKSGNISRSGNALHKRGNGLAQRIFPRLSPMWSRVRFPVGARSRRLYVNLVSRSILVPAGFLRVLRFPPASKIEFLGINLFWYNGFSDVLSAYMAAAQRLEHVYVDMSRVKNTQRTRQDKQREAPSVLTLRYLVPIFTDHITLNVKFTDPNFEKNEMYKFSRKLHF